MELKLASDKVLQIQDTLAKLDEIVALVSAFTMDEDKQTLVTGIVQNIEDIKLIVDSADEMDIIVADLIKGSYLGNRKIDIDLSLNKATETSIVSYRQVDIVLVNGTKLEIPFLSGGSVLELTSHNDIRNYIVNHASWSTIEYTECTVEEATTLSPTLMRFRDADGHSSNVERVELHVYSGTAKDIKPIYFWAQTTSALQTIANRVGDIIALGNDIDNIVALSQRIDELNELQSNLAELNSIHTNLGELLQVDTNTQTVLTKAAEVEASKAITLSAQASAQNQAIIAAAKATEATERANEIKGITAQTATGAAGTSAQVSYNPVDGKFSFVIPQGLKGDRGEAFSVNAMGTLAQRSGYDAQPINFSYFATDVSLIYFKNSATVADWSTGIPFGKGDKGDIGLTGNGIATIVRISGTGAAGTTDTYRITYTSGGTFDFNVYNGTQSDVDKAYVDAHKNNTSNPHAVTKAQVGLGSVDNTSDADKPLSDDAIAALAFKLDKADFINNFTKPSSTALFVKTSPSAFYIKAGFTCSVGSIPLRLVSNYALSLASNLDTGSKVAGTDYYVYAKSDGSFYISANSAITADRLIGGFHYGLVAEAEAISGNKTEADMVQIRGINAYSFWDLKFRPTCNPKGMVNINGRWYDIYLLNSEHITNGSSKAYATIAGGDVTYGRAIPKIPLAYGGNGTTNYGKFTWFQACEVAKSHGKELIGYDEFPTIAYGVVEGTDSATVGETVQGRVEHYAALTSKYGIEQATGVQWIWGKDLANGYGSTDFAYRLETDTRGQIYSTSNAPVAVILGGTRADGLIAGSRSSHWSNSVWNSGWYLGCRLACDHMELA